MTHGEGDWGARELPPGTLIGGYEIEGVAGRGGMGVVHRARDTELGRTVAVKVIGGGRADDPDLRALFIRESLTAAQLEHPNVLPLYRAGDDDGRLFIAMRFVEGASLEELIAAAPGGMPPGRAARIVARVADALDAAHARNLVHRDVKPGNVLIADPDGEEHVYLSDFGLTTGGDRAVTPGSGWAGTLAYLAPEQIRGEKLDARTDVYALGCVLFHALTGRAPFAGGDEQAVLDAHLHARPPAPSEVVPGLPPALDDVVRRAMAKRPEDRFATAGELGRAALAARYDVALLAAPGERAAAERLATGLQESELAPLVAVAGETSAVEGVRAAGACAVLVGREGLGAWARDGLATARRVADQDRAFRLVLVLLPGAPGPGDPSLGFMAGHPWVDLRSGAGDALAATDLVRALRGADVPAGLPAADGVSPYRGLEAFREEDASLYFGREQDVARVLERLRASRFVAIVGPSGSGKSSLAQAGVLPAIRRDALAAGDAPRVLELVPGARPLAALAAQLGHLPGAGAPSPADLAADERALDLAVARALDGRPADERVLILVDQLEEAFTLCADEGERAAFLGNLVYAATIPGGRTVVVVTMRADFYHRLAEHPELRNLVAAQQVLLGPLDARNLRRAIEEPARRCGLDLEPGLTRRILTDVADRPGTLPLLEHLLLEVWRRRRDRTLTLEAYGASGGVEGALARRANEVYGAMDPDRQAIARRVLLRLTQPGEGTEDTRRRATRGELVTDPAEQPEVDAVVEALAGARLVTTGTDDVTGEPVVEVTHEALIRGWPELRGWLDEDRDRLRAERRLSDAAAEWDRGGRDEGALYRGARLAAWGERDTSSLTPLERGFLTASTERAEHDRVARRRRVRIAIASLSVALAAIAGVAVFALIQRNDAADQRDESRSRELAANARLQLNGDPELSLLLASDALATAPTSEAESIYREATHASQVREAFRDHDGSVQALASTVDGTTIASAGADGTVRLWHPAGDAPTRSITGHDGDVYDVAMSADGASLASAGADGTVRLTPLASGSARVLRGHEGPVQTVAFRDDGRMLATGGDDGTVRLWPLPAGAPTVLQTGDGVVRAVAFGPDGSVSASGDGGVVRTWSSEGRLTDSRGTAGSSVFGVAVSPQGLMAAGGSDLRVRIWQPGETAPANVLRAADFSGIDDVSFSPDGRHLASAGQDGVIKIWTATGTSVATLRGHDGSVLDVRFLPDGRVVSAGTDGTVRVWSWTQKEPIDVLPGGGVAIAQQAEPAFTPDGDVLEGKSDGSVLAWRPGEAARPVVPPVAPDNTTGYAATADGTRVATSDFSGVTRVYDIDEGASDLAQTFRVTSGPVWVVKLTPDGTGAVTGGDDGTVRLWDVATGKGRILGSDPGPRLMVAVSPDGTKVASAGVDGQITIRSLQGDPAPVRLDGHVDLVWGGGWSPDGTHFISGGADRTVRVWDVATRSSTILGKHDTAVLTAAFSDDGRLALSSATDGVRVWDWRAGTVLFRPTLPGRVGYRAGLSPDSGRLAVVTVDDNLRLYDCETCGSLDEVEALAGERVTRQLTPDEEAAFGG